MSFYSLCTFSPTNQKRTTLLQEFLEHQTFANYWRVPKCFDCRHFQFYEYSPKFEDLFHLCNFKTIFWNFMLILRYSGLKPESKFLKQPFLDYHDYQIDAKLTQVDWNWFLICKGTKNFSYFMKLKDDLKLPNS